VQPARSFEVHNEWCLKHSYTYWITWCLLKTKKGREQTVCKHSLPSRTLLQMVKDDRRIDHFTKLAEESLQIPPCLLGGKKKRKR
jgi:hypothetical protein